jgi:hypothetical protein
MELNTTMSLPKRGRTHPTVTLKILNRSGLVAESAAGHGLITFLLERGS